MIDTHAHLNFPEFEGKVAEIVVESKKAGVSGIVLGSSDIEASKRSLALAKEYPGFLFASVGIHPHKTDQDNKRSVEEQLKGLDMLISETLKGNDARIANRQGATSDETERRNELLDRKTWPIVAIGETGLDFSEPPPRESSRSKKEQEKLFLGQINLAIKYNLPLVVHARGANNDVINILGSISEHNVSGTFHCYSGGRKRIAKILALPGKWYFGFDGNLTYDIGLQNIIKLLPEDRILLETDSPYLAPVPHRGEICTPAFIPLIQAQVNEIFGKDLTETIKKNSKTLFNI